MNVQNLIFEENEEFNNRKFYQTTNDNLINITHCTQDINWVSDARLNFQKRKLMHHHGFRCVEPIQVTEVNFRNNFHSTKQTDIFYQFKTFYKSLPIKITHFQVRKNFYLLDSKELIYPKKMGIESFNIVTNKKQTLCLLNSIDDNPEHNYMICFDAVKNSHGDYIICIGKSDGSVKLFKVPYEEINRLKEYKNDIIPKFDLFLTKIISDGTNEEVFTNYVRFINNGNELVTTGNDGYIRIFDLNKNFNKKNEYKVNFPVNHCDMNFSENILGCIGDSRDVELLDTKSKMKINQFVAHNDYGVVLKFQPESDNIFATGNQDYSCKLWDLRKINYENQNNNSTANCVKTLCGHFDSIGDLSFVKNKFLIYCENTDYVHCYNIQNNTIQTLSYLGNFAGLAVNDRNQNFYIGTEETSYSGILAYEKIRNNLNCLNNLNLYI